MTPNWPQCNVHAALCILSSSPTPSPQVVILQAKHNNWKGKGCKSLQKNVGSALILATELILSIIHSLWGKVTNTSNLVTCPTKKHYPLPLSISHPTEGRRLSLPSWLICTKTVQLQTVTYFSTNWAQHDSFYQSVQCCYCKDNPPSPNQDASGIITTLLSELLLL